MALISWGTLYKILEVLEEDQFPPIMRRGKYKKTANLLTHMADSHLAVGFNARHLHERFKPPKKPMTLSEAQTFVKLVLTEWLKEKELQNAHLSY